jgi:ferredoxin-NADP reductase
MAGTTVLGRLNWQVCDVVDLLQETPTVRSLVLECPDWPGHVAGQHVDVRLTAEDGYQAERSYSIATPSRAGRIVLTVERLENGEVSPYLCDELRVGDQLELRGPIGGYFVWEPEEQAPVMLFAGGSGIVPLMSMIRKRIQTGSETPMRLLLSARFWEEIIYRSALESIVREEEGVEVFQTLTRWHPVGWAGFSRRVDRTMITEVGWPPEDNPLAFVCGPTGFVEAVANHLVDLGHPAEKIRTERFGPTGGTL